MFILKILNGDIYEFFKNEIFYELWDDGEGYIEDGQQEVVDVQVQEEYVGYSLYFLVLDQS